MYRRLAALLMALLLLPALSLAEEKRVYMAGETEAFGAEEKLLTVRVAPLLGADSMLVTYGEHSMLVDMGTRGQANKVYSVLQEAGLERVEYAFNTHPHDDHLGGIIPLMNKGIQFDQFLTAFPHDYTGRDCVQRSSVKAVKEAGIPVVDIDDGDTIAFGDVEMTVLRQTVNTNDNQRSAMLMIRYGECSMLLTADVSERGQPILAEMHDLKADIMKYPHHGVSLNQEVFLDEVAPEFVFIPHGAIETKPGQKQLAERGIPVMFANWGTIILQSNGEKWIVEQVLTDKMKEYAANYQLK